MLPPEWFDRMNTIKEGGKDDSAAMRLNSWAMSFNLAKKFPLGAGFDCFSMENYERYSPRPELGAATQDGKSVGSTAHSIYFQIMATQGFGGFALYMIALFSMLFSLLKLSKLGKKLPSGEWITMTSRGIMGTILGFMASGAFLSLAFFDLFWAIYGAGICLKSIVHSGTWLHEETLPFFR
jgi:probable O-glycosylation ligase (exosortase A-associated)